MPLHCVNHDWVPKKHTSRNMHMQSHKANRVNIYIRSSKFCNFSGAELCHRPGLLSRRLPLHFDLGAQIGGDTTKTGVWVKHIGCFYDLSHVNTTLDPKWQPKKNKVQHSTGFNITKSLLKIIKYQKPPKKITPAPTCHSFCRPPQKQ